MFDSFRVQQQQVNGIRINYRIGGAGPGLLLLHGHPQTHVMWHKVAERLAQQFTVVVADLRGYGDSEKPPASATSADYAKRVMAQDQIELMAALGFRHFSVMAHDRGARVAHRLGIDHPDAVNRMILLDIAPTLSMYEQTNQEFARAYWHWFFLIRPSPLPETLIEANPEAYLKGIMGARSAGLSPFTREAFAEYLRCLSAPGAARGICEDYRAAAGIDLQHEREDRAEKRVLECPLLVLWGRHGTVGRCFNPLEEWSQVASNVQGLALPCGHYIAEEAPDILLENALDFL